MAKGNGRALANPMPTTATRLQHPTQDYTPTTMLPPRNRSYPAFPPPKIGHQTSCMARTQLNQRNLQVQTMAAARQTLAAKRVVNRAPRCPPVSQLHTMRVSNSDFFAEIRI